MCVRERKHDYCPSESGLFYLTPQSPVLSIFLPMEIYSSSLQANKNFIYKILSNKHTNKSPAFPEKLLKASLLQGIITRSQTLKSPSYHRHIRKKLLTPSLLFLLWLIFFFFNRREQLTDSCCSRSLPLSSPKVPAVLTSPGHSTFAQMQAPVHPHYQ